MVDYQVRLPSAAGATKMTFIAIGVYYTVNLMLRALLSPLHISVSPIVINVSLFSISSGQPTGEHRSTAGENTGPEGGSYSGGATIRG